MLSDHNLNHELNQGNKRMHMLWIVALLALSAGPALADTNVYGIPDECEVSIWSCAPPGKTGPEAPRRLERTFMSGRWSSRAAHASPSRRFLLFHQDRKLVLRFGDKRTEIPLDLTAYASREVAFSPDERLVATWGPRASAESPGVIALTRLQPGKDPTTKVAYTGTKDRRPFAFAFSPSGSSLYVASTASGDAKGTKLGRVERVAIPSLKPKVIYEAPGPIDLLAPPVAYFSRGQGPIRRPYEVLVGEARGLFLVDARGRSRPLKGIQGRGIQNVAWYPNPRTRELLVYVHKPPTGGQSGVYRLDLSTASPALELLEATSKVHTLWYSPNGRLATWATPEAVVVCDLQASPPATRRFKSPGAEIKGCEWNLSSQRVAITLGGELWAWEPARDKRTKLTQFTVGFLADPRWAGDHVLVSHYRKAKAPASPVAPR
jgi:hypothetical protein